jgi:hypothetical protein
MQGLLFCLSGASVQPRCKVLEQRKWYEGLFEDERLYQLCRPTKEHIRSCTWN